MVMKQSARVQIVPSSRSRVHPLHHMHVDTPKLDYTRTLVAQTKVMQYLNSSTISGILLFEGLILQMKHHSVMSFWFESRLLKRK